MDYFYSLYADYILKHSIELGKDDVLSINTEQRYVPFARLLAQKAKEITGNGSFLVMIEDKRAKDAIEIYSDYVIEKAPTVFIHLQARENEPVFENGKIYSARDAQLFSHLASPVVLAEAEVSFLTVPMPSREWAESIYEEYEEKDVAAIISDFLGLSSESALPLLKDAISIDEYDLGNLNYHKGLKASLYSDDGMIDLTFSFVKGSSFKSLIFQTKEKRKFIPYLFSSSYFRAIEKTSASGHIYTDLPFRLFGKTIKGLSLEFERGKITRFSSRAEDAERINTYIAQDDDASRLAEISLTEAHQALDEIPLFSHSEWDKLRGVVLTLGAPRSEAVHFSDESDAIKNNVSNSLFTLSIPLGKKLTLTIENEEGDDVVYSDGFIEDYQ